MGRLSVLVVGAGAREHALAWRLRRDPDVGRLFAAPGSDAIGEVAERVPLAADAVGDLADWAAERRIDLTVVGPEAPLVAGLADRFRERGLCVLGPDAGAARIEGSKAWARAFCLRHGIPGPRHRTFHSASEAEAFLAGVRLPVVVKADGLAAGKGVTVASRREEALAAAREALGRGPVVVEEFLQGRELSAFALADGRDLVTLACARDYKRLRDGDRGPNTGGMGAYSPVGDATPELVERIERRILRPAVEGLAAEGTPFRGFLYAGLMLTPDGPQVLEFNARLGDPEAQVLLPRWEGPFAALLLAAARGELGRADPPFAPEAAVGVVLASAGYPEDPRPGEALDGLEALPDDVLVFHGGTRRQDGRWRTAGGRVLTVVGRGATVGRARQQAYAAAERVRFAGRQMRHDVAAGEP